MASAACNALASVDAKSPSFIHSGAHDALLKLMLVRIGGARAADDGRWATHGMAAGAVCTEVAGFEPVSDARQAFMVADKGAGSPAATWR